MIAADTSTLIAFLEGASGPDIERLAYAAASGDLVLPPVVVVEVLGATAALQTVVPDIALLDVRQGFWKRAGRNRSLLREKGLKANLGDTLIAQFCIDHGVALITRDADFRHFAKHCGLKLT